MKLKFNKIMAGLVTAGALSFASAGALATPINVGGVIWDPDSPFDFSAQSSLVESVATNAGETISGYGRITEINLQNQLSFCPGCELTFVFSGYTLQNNLTPAVGESFFFSGGVFDFYVSAPNSDFTNPATFSDGIHWLSLVGADPLGLGYTLGGALTNVSAVGAQISGEGSGFLDVVGGLAAAYFDTNSQFGADFLYTSSFQPLATPIGDATHLGTAEIVGQSQVVPEPGVLALLGIGLVGIGLTGRMKKAA